MAKNTTRQTTIKETKGKPHLNGGFDNNTTDYQIPGVGIEDVDVSLFNLFDKDIGFRDRSIYSADQKIAIQKPLVIFASGEKFAVAKRLKPPRDKNQKLLLPAISIRRTSLTQTEDDLNGRGINQTTGLLQIKRRFDPQDKNYQSLINKLALKNMVDLPTSNRNNVGELKNDVDIINGALLTNKTNNNLIEVITIPQPQFFTATYEVTFWTNYSQHMNYLIETYLSSFLPQIRGHKLNTDKGYWFMAYTEDSFTNQENFDDFSEDTRIIRYSFNVSVKGYILIPDYETNMVPVRSHISSPIITFDTFPHEKPFDSKIVQNENVKNKFLLNDVNNDVETAQESTTDKKYVYEKTIINQVTGKKTKKVVTARDSSQKNGETIYHVSQKESLEDFIKTLGS